MQENKNITSFRVSDGNTVKLEYRNRLASTTTLAREYAKAGYPDRYAVFTEQQLSSHITTAHSVDGEFDNGLFISLILRPSVFPSQAGLIGPLSAVAFASALEEHTDKKISIGWISDLFCDSRRIGGCAVEGKLGNSTSYEYMIVTFAVKLNATNFPPRLTDMVRKVFEPDNASVAMIIAKTVLNKFFEVYRDLKTPEKHMDAYEKRFALTGCKIRYTTDGKKRRCTVLGIDKATCSLLIETSEGIKDTLTSPFSVIIPNRLRPKN